MATKKKEKSELSYNVRDIVLAKVRGFPPWPGMVVDPDEVPKSVQRERPKGSKALFYCVKFFPAGDHSWSLAKDMSRLQKHEIEAYIAEPHKKNGDLLSGYRIALDPVQWEKEQVEKQALAAEEEAALEVDQLDADAEADDSDEPKKPAKKRKRESDSGVTKPKKKKSSGAEKSESAPKKRRKSTKGKNGHLSAETIESEDEGADRGGEGASEEPGPSKTSPTSARKAKRDKDADAEDGEDAALANDPEAQKVKEWRHRLQRGFLGKSVPPESEMAGYDETFTTVEKYDKLTIEYLSFSKIGKVMRKIAALDPPPPLDEEYNFKARAAVLVAKWQKIISKGSGKADGGEADDSKEKGAAPVVNGNGANTATKDGDDVTMGESRPRETSGEADMEIDPPKAD